MVNVHRHNPALRARLKPLADTADAIALQKTLAALSNSEFRTAGILLSEDLLPGVPTSAAFLDLFFGIVPSNPKAYLMTFLKAARTRYAQGRLDLHDSRWDTFAAQASPIDRAKTADTLLPAVHDLTDAMRLLTLFTDDSVPARATVLLRAGTTVAYFLLFQTLKKVEDDRPLIARQYLQLIRKADKRSYNLASILRHYFDLHDLPGNLSLRLQPYQFSRLDITLDTFSKILNQ